MLIALAQGKDTENRPHTGHPQRIDIAQHLTASESIAEIIERDT
jgi:hypothetical protein